MIIQKTITVTLNSFTIGHFEKLGYKILRIYSKNLNRFCVPKGTKIKIKVLDLQKGSNIEVLCRCDKCGKENKVAYHNATNYLCKSCASFRKGKFGKDNPSWNSSLTDAERKGIRIGSKLWRKEVLQRDKHTCQKCGSKEHLQAHHINSYTKFKNQRTDIDNGITLCKNCHKDFHKLYGKITTHQMFLEFTELPH